MRPRIAIVACVLALTPTAAYADEVGQVQGLTCGLATTGSAGVLTGGPLAVTGELAIAVTVHCTVRVNGAVAAGASFQSSGPVGVLPPTPVTVPANPATDRVDVCTGVEWLFGFPGGGFFDLGCRDAASRTGLLPGYLALPDVVV